MLYKHILFDLDRTLWDFKTNNTNTLKELFIYFNLEERCNCSFEKFLEIYNIVNNTLWEDYRQGTIEKEILAVKRFHIVLDYFGTKHLSDTLKMSNYYLTESPQKKQLLPYATELLEYLHSKNYCMHIITNGFKEVQYVKIKTANINRFFSNIFISEEIGFQKPDKRIFEFVLSCVNATAKECIMIGDDFKVDILGARSINMDAIFFNSEKSKVDLDSNTYQINSLEQIKNIL